MSFFTKIKSLLQSNPVLDEGVLEQLSEQLLLADVAWETVDFLMIKLKKTYASGRYASAEEALQQVLIDLITPYQKTFNLAKGENTQVIMMVGVNGVGKTTTTAKLANFLQQQNKSIMLACGDTFRAAAGEQLNAWAEKLAVPIVLSYSKTDSAAIIFDALESAQAKGIQVLIADTAGRLNNKEHLMEQLHKIIRVVNKLDSHAPHEILLVVDGLSGQNVLKQIKSFKDHINVTGLVISKMDSSAKGGIVFSAVHRYKMPIYFIGTGESINDLQPFDAEGFVKKLFDN